MGTRARVTTVAGAATLLCAAGVFGAGSAIAAPGSTASAAPQSLIGTCGDTVRGTPGQRVGLQLAGLSVVDLGQVPTSGATTFDATSIVRDLLGPLAPACQLTAEALALPAVLTPVETATIPLLGAIQDTVGSVPVLPQQPAPAAPVAPAAPPAPAATPAAGAALPAQPATAPMHGPFLPQFTPFAFGRYHAGMPLYNYAELLLGSRGGFGRLQTGALAADLFRASSGSLAAGSLTVESLAADAQNSPAAKDVAAAGEASALPAGAAERVALPVLIAALMLAAIVAAVLRSWVVVTRR